MSINRKLVSRIRSHTKSLVLAANYWLNNYNEVIWLIGNGRSGTTWVADLLNHRKGYREMFEPFHPHLVDGMGFLQPHQYIRPGEPNQQLEEIAAEVFSGKFRHPSVDYGNRSFVYNGLLIKDIFANLFAYWAAQRFPNIKIVLLIRNPFSVALSTYKKRDWLWVTDPLDLLNQPALHADHLQPFEDLIRETSRGGDYILRQLLIWAIINYVPLRQFKPGEIHICFYEDIRNRPNEEISNILEFVKPAAGNIPVSIDREIIARPSRVTDKDSLTPGKAGSNRSWENELTAQQIDTGLEILRCFGFDELYNQASIPDRRVIERIQDPLNPGAGEQMTVTHL